MILTDLDRAKYMIDCKDLEEAINNQFPRRSIISNNGFYS